MACCGGAAARGRLALRAQGHGIRGARSQRQPDALKNRGVLGAKGQLQARGAQGEDVQVQPGQHLVVQGLGFRQRLEGAKLHGSARAAAVGKDLGSTGNGLLALRLRPTLLVVLPLSLDLGLLLLSREGDR